MVKNSVLTQLFLVTLFIFALQAIGSVFFWYDKFPWFDIPMHMLGGFWIALLGVYLLSERHKIFSISNNGWVASTIFFLGWVAVLGIAWEVFELAAGVIPAYFSPLFVRSIPNYPDSLYDLVNDVLGAIPAVWMAIRRLGR